MTDISTLWSPVTCGVLRTLHPSDLSVDAVPDMDAGLSTALPAARVRRETPFPTIADEGTAFHAVMEELAFARLNAAELRELMLVILERHRMVGSPASTEARLDQLSQLHGAAITIAPLCEELRKAAASGRLFHELPLRYQLDDGAWVDGLIDLVWLDDRGQLHVLDYKTGWKHPTIEEPLSGELIHHYAQVLAYADGLERCLGRSVASFGIWYIAGESVLRWAKSGANSFSSSDGSTNSADTAAAVLVETIEDRTASEVDDHVTDLKLTQDETVTTSPMSLREAAIVVLREKGPLHYQELTDEILNRRLAESESKTPSASLNAVITVDLKQKGSKSPFVRVAKGVIGLRPQDFAGVELGVEEDGEAAPVDTRSEERVRTPLFPPYHEVRHLMHVWVTRNWKQVTGLRSTIGELRGTPQNTVDWTDPDEWIPTRLSGPDRELAAAIWKESAGEVNPRHAYGHWLLARKYDLISTDATGVILLTPRGLDFIENPTGEATAYLDEQEGLIKLLALVADNGPTRTGGITDDWAEYLNRRSAFGSTSTIKDTLRRRLKNLLLRGLLERKSTMYSITDSGLAYLEREGDEEALAADEQQELWALLQQQRDSIRGSLRELLFDMDPYAFEHLVKRLLEEMDYQNVEVTTRGGDGGVDVIGEIELGITAVREVVQVKRHKRTIQRKDLDALRGSLYRFNAVRGTIITTSQFSKGTKEESFAPGVAPITLIDGEKLVDMLIEHGIGVRKRTVELLELDVDALAEIETE